MPFQIVVAELKGEGGSEMSNSYVSTSHKHLNPEKHLCRDKPPLGLCHDPCREGVYAHFRPRVACATQGSSGWGVFSVTLLQILGA